MIETVSPAEPRMFTLWPFTNDNVPQPLISVIYIMYKTDPSGLSFTTRNLSAGVCVVTSYLMCVSLPQTQMRNPGTSILYNIRALHTLIV